MCGIWNGTPAPCGVIHSRIWFVPVWVCAGMHYLIHGSSGLWMKVTDLILLYYINIDLQDMKFPTSLNFVQGGAVATLKSWNVARLVCSWKIDQDYGHSCRWKDISLLGRDMTHSSREIPNMYSLTTRTWLCSCRFTVSHGNHNWKAIFFNSWCTWDHSSCCDYAY